MKPKVAVYGSNGRMGQVIAKLVRDNYSDRHSELILFDQGDHLNQLEGVDTIIDFSTPQASLELMDFINNKSTQTAVVSGTTGWNDVQLSKIEEYKQKIRLFLSSNYSLGIYFLNKVIRDNGKILVQMGFQPRIEETHHIHKVDSPSGTAVTLIKNIAKEFNITPQVKSFRAG